MTSAPPRPEASYAPAPDPDDPPLRKLYRSADGRMLGGVARGLAGHLGLPVSWVRVVFIALFMAEGMGALLYAAFWFIVPLGVGGVDATRANASAAAPGLLGKARGRTGRKADRARSSPCSRCSPARPSSPRSSSWAAPTRMYGRSC